MTAPDPWAGILDPGETVLWQGRPDTRPQWAMLSPQRLTLGVVFIVAAALWGWQSAGLAQAGGAMALLPWIAVPLLAVGLFNLAGHVLWDAFRRRCTWYTLTNRRAFIATDIPFRGKRLKSYPINRETILSFDESEPASIGFAFEPVPMKRSTRMKMVGFERIADGQTVFALMRGVQGKIERDFPIDPESLPR